MEGNGESGNVRKWATSRNDAVHVKKTRKKPAILILKPGSDEASVNFKFLALEKRYVDYMA